MDRIASHLICHIEYCVFSFQWHSAVSLFANNQIKQCETFYVLHEMAPDDVLYRCSPQIDEAAMLTRWNNNIGQQKEEEKKSRTMDANGCGRWRVSFANKRIPFDCHRLVGRFFDLFRYHVILFSNVIIFNSSCEIYFSWIIAFADKAHATESFRWMEMPSNCEFVIKRN